jgi:hypothetical protein
VLPVGAHPGNTGGKKGRSGRPPDAFRDLCRRLASSDEVFDAVKRILADADHPAFMRALKWAAEHGYGRETLTVVSPEVVTRIERTQKLIASRPTWDAKELIDRLGAEVWV